MFGGPSDACFTNNTNLHCRSQSRALPHHVQQEDDDTSNDKLPHHGAQSYVLAVKVEDEQLAQNWDPKTSPHWYSTLNYVTALLPMVTELSVRERFAIALGNLSQGRCVDVCCVDDRTIAQYTSAWSEVDEVFHGCPPSVIPKIMEVGFLPSWDAGQQDMIRKLGFAQPCVYTSLCVHIIDHRVRWMRLAIRCCFMKQARHYVSMK